MASILVLTSCFAGLDQTEKIANDFNNEQIVKLYGKQMEKIAGKKAELLQEKVAQKTRLQQQMEQFRQQNDQVQEQLDQSIDEMENKMTDISNVVEYDADRLGKKYHGAPGSKGKAEVPCLAERTNIATCMAGKQKSCDFFINALEDCVGQTIRK